MAIYLFTRAILAGEPIDVFNYGKMQRDFTYIDDIVTGVLNVAERPPHASSKSNGHAAASGAPYRLYNIGNNRPVELLKLIEVLEECLGKKTTKNMLPLQAGDVYATFADVDDLMRDTGFRPSTAIEDGIAKFVSWYRPYYSNRESTTAPLQKNHPHSAA
jgi:UDP-glucuronate 4-epimerase